MSRYIDAEKIKFDISGLAYIYPSDFRKIGAYFIRQIRKMPTADVRENVHGEWIPHILHGANVQWGYDCSICGDWFVVGSEYIKKHKFCRNCGADMRGKNKC